MLDISQSPGVNKSGSINIEALELIFFNLGIEKSEINPKSTKLKENSSILVKNQLKQKTYTLFHSNDILGFANLVKSNLEHNC